MPRLGETTAFLSNLRRAGETRSSSPGTTRRCRTVADFGDNPGALRMLIYMPEGLAPRAPLVVVLHGCTQTAESYADNAGWLELAQRLGCVIVAPEQVPSNNANRCFNWFEPADTTRGQGEVASIAAMIRWTIAHESVDPERVFVTGLSAGGAMAGALLATYPELFAGGAVIGGLPYAAARSMQGALGAMRSGVDGAAAAGLAETVRAAAPPSTRPLKLSIWHGTADHVVNAANGKAVADQWRRARGLAEAAPATSASGRSLQTWSDGSSTIELHMIQGMGHGTPLAAQGPDGLGSAAPFMLEVGISSTRETAKFWGLGEAQAATMPVGEAIESSIDDATIDILPHGIGAQVLDGLKSHIPQAVQEQIAKAFKAAGLA